MSAKILLLDIETAPSLGYVWAKWETNVIDYHSHWYILSIAYKWSDEDRVSTLALPDYPNFKINREDDSALVCDIRGLLDEADIVVGHNADKFDLRKINARMLSHGLSPPSQYKTVDTLKLARKHFQFDSNKLDDLGGYLGVGRKLPHTGAHLWLGCMQGDVKAWRKMRRYNARDVELLEAIWLKLRPWSTNPPNLTFYSGNTQDCPVCESKKTKNDGYNYLRTGKRQRRECLSCGHRYSTGTLIREAA